MGQTYKQFWGELVKYIPKLPPPLAQRFLNRAWHDIQDSRQWSFLKSDGLLYTPAVITTGSFSVQLGNLTVTANSLAINALSNLGVGPDLTKRQIRFSTVGGSPVYSITRVDPDFTSNGILYLNRIYTEATNATASYRCYRCYYGPPQISTVSSDGTVTTEETTDFLRYNDIFNPRNARWFIPGILPSEILDRRDPMRSNATAGSIPIAMFAYKTINNVPNYEMYPHPLYSNGLPCSYQRRGVDFQSDSETLPSMIPDDLLMERALFYTCGWAAANQNLYSELKGTNWRLEAQVHKQSYSNIDSKNPGLLELAQARDEEVYPQNTVMDSRGYRNFPLGYDDIMVYPSLTI